MPDTITQPAPVIDQALAPRSKWEREYQAFRHLLPQLLTTHRGHYVAIHEGEVVESGPDRLALVKRVLGRLGNVDIHVGLVTEAGEPLSRSGVRRDLSINGDTL